DRERRTERVDRAHREHHLFQIARVMAYVVCCATLEVKYRKRGGGCKVLNDTSIQLSDIDLYLNRIMRKPNFSSFISVRMIDIHDRPLQSADSDDSDDS
ncbi:unnamed protein product, partial [Ectocarpus sp. 12 AP-2014]